MSEKKGGLYKQISSVVRTNMGDRAVINAEKLLDVIYNSISLHKIPRKEKDRFILSFILRVVLNQIGYRSLIRGKKIYVNPELMDSKDLGSIIENIDGNIDALTTIRNKIADLDNNINGQMFISVDDNTIREEITTDELFELLQEKYGV